MWSGGRANPRRNAATRGETLVFESRDGFRGRLTRGFGSDRVSNDTLSPGSRSPRQADWEGACVVEFGEGSRLTAPPGLDLEVDEARVLIHLVVDYHPKRG